MATTRTAVRVQPAFDDAGAVRKVIEAAGPFWPLSRYAGNPEEMQALGGRSGSDNGGAAPSAFTPPWFRQDFALAGRPVVADAGVILDNSRFVDAARAVYGEAAVVRPSTVYVNVMGPTPFPFAAHLDVPAFRGVTRADHPIWLLKVMKTSGLFEAWRVWIATAVSWFYAGPGGDFYYWPDGPDDAHAVERAPFDNVAVVADNEATFHGVGPLGRPGDRMPRGLSHESRLVRGDGEWLVVHDDAVVASYTDEVVRITVSWKADVHADAAAAARADSGADCLDLERVVAMFLDDLHARGIDAALPSDPLRDRTWVGLLGTTYVDPSPAIG